MNRRERVGLESIRVWSQNAANHRPATPNRKKNAGNATVLSEKSAAYAGDAVNAAANIAADMNDLNIKASFGASHRSRK